jgi:hypothetical protein
MLEGGRQFRRDTSAKAVRTILRLGVGMVFFAVLYQAGAFGLPFQIHFWSA